MPTDPRTVTSLTQLREDEIDKAGAYLFAYLASVQADGLKLKFEPVIENGVITCIKVIPYNPITGEEFPEGRTV